MLICLCGIQVLDLGRAETTLQSSLFPHKKLWVIPRIRHFSLQIRQLQTPNKPDSVIALLKNHGFSKTQIAILIKRPPCVLASDVEKTLLPKITFLNSKGISSSDLAKCLSKCPSLLILSLENRIIPSFNFLCDLLQSNNDILGVLNLFTRMLLYDFDSYILPNSNVLRQNGVPELNIDKGFRRVPKTFFYTPIQFKEIVEKVKQMGFSPERFTFIFAVTVLG
ncbi:hypothetical protein J1N35_016567 [Gossypium stocksii]|uniref:Uncharacterized protein n=1 Tax=Gossypium stocksii TaxID=47602 RepID=A0A9D3VLX4_9ROSI|nr:hypothetical protein J1N35_016567 [Gossypium stocksii]